MMRKFTALLAAFAFAATTLAPVSAADAQRYRRDGYHDGGRHRDYDRRRHWRGHDDDGDAVAAGVVGLVLGLAIGSLASQPSQPRAVCRDNYQRCPPPRYEDRRGYEQQGYDPRYDDRDSAYERDYGLEGGRPEGSYDPYYDEPAREQCTRRERQWDRYANRYVVVDVPC